MKRSTDGTAHTWKTLGGDTGLLDKVRYRGPDGLLASALPVMPLARSTVAACSLAAAELAARRTGGPVPETVVDDGAVATAFVSERQLRIEGRAPMNFARLSRFWQTSDGWVRTHANYPHHRTRLLEALGIEASGGDAALAERVAAALAEREAEDVEETVHAAGGLAVAVREPQVWTAGPQGAAVAARPLLDLERVGDAPAPTGSTPLPAGDGRAAAGVRVLDLSRVLAGPVATRSLALLGADVLRIDAPDLPESQDTYADTGLGKRSTALDLASSSGRETFEELLSAADVVVTGYRPGSLDRFGLSPEALAERRPGLVVARLSAWDTGTGTPWADRRGFDSLVQAATGIAAVEAAPQGRPGALPAQALDHGTGYLLAAAVLRALTERLDNGGSWLATLALTRTAAWLLDGTGLGGETDSAEDARAGRTRPVAEPYDAGKWLAEGSGPLGRVRYARSPLGYEGVPGDWEGPAGLLGADAPSWR